MEEIWKEIPNFEGLYQASNFGRIKSLGNDKNRKEKILKPRLSNKGYPVIRLCKNGKAKNYYIHRLVWLTFNGEIPKGYEINHIDENPQNGCLDNLNLLSHRDNICWGTCPKRIGEPQSKPVIQKSLQGEVIRIWSSLMEIHRELGYSYGNISSCCRGNRKSAYKYLWEYAE